MSGIKPTIQYPTIALSGSISGDIPLGGARAIGILAPALTSGQLFFQVNVDTSSANFQRVWDANGANEYSWDVAAGSAGIVLRDSVWPFDSMRIESSVFQTAVRSFAVITRF